MTPMCPDSADGKQFGAMRVTLLIVGADASFNAVRSESPLTAFV